MLLRKTKDGSIDDDQPSIRTRLGVNGIENARINHSDIPSGYELFIQSRSSKQQLGPGRIIILSLDGFSGLKSKYQLSSKMVETAENGRKGSGKRCREAEGEVSEDEISAQAYSASASSKRTKLVENEINNTSNDPSWDMNMTHPNLTDLTIDAVCKVGNGASIVSSCLSVLPRHLHRLELSNIDFGVPQPNLRVLFPQLTDLHLDPYKLATTENLPVTLLRMNDCLSGAAQSL